MNTHLAVGALLLGLPVLTVIATAWPSHAPGTGIAAGRQVYIAEGCMHCHSQYVRPGTTDTELWGEARPPDWSRAQTPALIGNRRQGPDLMNVGLRLPRAWHRLHLQDPRRVAPASRMPGYAHLFGDGDPRGEALLDYLDSLGREPDRPAPVTGARPPASAASDGIPPTPVALPPSRTAAPPTAP